MALTPPTVTAVVAQLTTLRQGYGISRRKVEKDGSLIASLRLVDVEVRRTNRPTEDRPSVAVDVLECVATDEDVLGADDRAIMTATLNFKGDRKRYGDRCVELQTKFSVLPDQFKNIERDAYERFAGLLIRLTRSPCSPETVRSRTAERARREWNALQDMDAVHYMEMALERLRLSRSPEEAREAARRVLEQIPLGAEAAADHIWREEKPLVLELFTRITSADTGVYEGWTDAAFDVVGWDSAAKDMMLATVQAQLTADEPRGIHQEAWEGGLLVRDFVTADLDLDDYQEAGLPGPFKIEDLPLRAMLLYEHGWAVLARVLVDTELRDGWSELWPPRERLRDVVPA